MAALNGHSFQVSGRGVKGRGWDSGLICSLVILDAESVVSVLLLGDLPRFPLLYHPLLAALLLTRFSLSFSFGLIAKQQ